MPCIQHQQVQPQSQPHPILHSHFLNSRSRGVPHQSLDQIPSFHSKAAHLLDHGMERPVLPYHLPPPPKVTWATTKAHRMPANTPSPTRDPSPSAQTSEATEDTNPKAPHRSWTAAVPTDVPHPKAPPSSDPTPSNPAPPQPPPHPQPPHPPGPKHPRRPPLATAPKNSAPSSTSQQATPQTQHPPTSPSTRSPRCASKP